jgi:hypothetical protein
MFWCDGRFFMACENLVVQISAEGAIDILYQADAPVHNIVVNKRQDGFVTVGFALNDKVLFITPDQGEIFTIDMVTVDVKILLDGHFVVAGKKNVFVYDDSFLGEIRWEYEVENEVVAVFPGPNRDQLGVLESNGKITLHNIS